MLRQLPIAGVVAQQQQQDARRGSSLSLADAEDAVVKAGVKGNGVDGGCGTDGVAGGGREVSNKPGKSIVGTFVVMFDYEQTPGKDDELTIRVGDLVAASNVYEDGWAVGRVLRTNKTGFFPFNAVYPVFSASGTPLRNAQEVPETVCGVAVSPSPTLLFQDGVISKEDYESIVK
ncbi:hypothetical protein BCR33DRAFT_740223 [Rhizoclosmatium globosum]|uniref:SH3 domain-containing protein n=1 Tax=Rhizoclosmatium globosum TaxID=329046 RepID=A0A1Y2BZZ8_9FUNG|nr:hypothetical protein BCR33DRAFT_740223 [Rhizoclosmatium globosum]|eukprot:ORY40348.1 hypothetical protein BCR33DRAFT_740223 [Rhizoclosmatium globosum]